MKKLIFAVAVSTALVGFADGEKPEEVQSSKPPIVWGFGNYGFYSGYQLYGSIVNTEPTLQGYFEINANLPFEVGPMDDLGYLGGGVWSNTDLTGKRNESMRRAFNEFDFNVHWGKTFWFDDEKTVGLTYRTSVVWYWYPHTGGNRESTKTTMDWNHYFELANPYVVPYINVVHEYLLSDGNLLQFGVKKPFEIEAVEGLTLTPFIELVWRNRNYGWCFSNFGNGPDGEKIGAGLATLKLELDATYMITDNFGVFAKVAYCQNLDPNLREAADYCYDLGDGSCYGRYNEFCWGGVGLCFSF